MGFERLYVGVGGQGKVSGFWISRARTPRSTASALAKSKASFAARRLSGEKNIVPDAATGAEITAAGKTKLVATFRVCVDVTGTVSKTTQLRSSGFPDYDRKLLRAIGTWTYRPVVVDDEVVPVCTAITFAYAHHS